MLKYRPTISEKFSWRLVMETAKKPRLSEKNIQDRYQFAEMTKKFTFDDWKKIIFTDESPFPLNWMANRQVDQIWAKNSGDVPLILTVKKSKGIQMWGALSASGLSQLHIWTQSFHINADKYTTDILEEELCEILSCRASIGSITCPVKV